MDSSEPGYGWAEKTRGSRLSKQCDCSSTPAFFLSPQEVAAPSLCTSLLSALDTHFEASQGGVDEYAILHPSAFNGVFFFQPEEGKLAVSSACTRELFREARQQIKDGVNLLSATRAILLLSGDNSSIWNIRKRVVEASGDYSVYLEEVQLTTLIFSARAKASNAWAHRRWACKVIAMSSKISEDDLSFFWSRELAICQDIASKYPRNYYAWTHRLWVCNYLPLQSGYMKGLSLEEELAWANELFRKNVSDRSISHHIEQLILLCLKHELKNSMNPASLVLARRRSLILRQLAVSANLVELIPGHKSLWQHLRTTMRIFLDSAFTHENADGAHEAFDIACQAIDHQGKNGDFGVYGEKNKYNSTILSGEGNTDVPWWIIVCSHFHMCNLVMRGAVAWNIEVQKECALTYACDLTFSVIVHLEKVSTWETGRHIHARLVAFGSSLIHGRVAGITEVRSKEEGRAHSESAGRAKTEGFGGSDRDSGLPEEDASPQPHQRIRLWKARYTEFISKRSF